MNFPSRSSSALPSRSIRQRNITPKLSQSVLGPDDDLPATPLLTEEERQDLRESSSSGSEGFPASYSRPTVVLVRNNLSTPYLPFSEPQKVPRRSSNERVQGNENEDYFSYVHLTPRPTLPERASTDSAGPSSYVPHLPTPNLTASHGQDVLGNVLDFFKEAYKSFSPMTNGDHIRSPNAQEDEIYTPGQPVLPYSRRPAKLRKSRKTMSTGLKIFSDVVNFGNEAEQRPSVSRTYSTATSGSSQSVCSHKSSSSIDSGRSTLLPKVNTTSKFTNKWPMPSYVRSASEKDMAFAKYKVVKTGLDDIDELPEDDENLGLGMERVGYWTVHKWILAFSVLVVFTYSLSILIYSILTWYQTWTNANVMQVADFDILILITLCASTMLFAALVGGTGTLLNSRPILAVYAVLLWPAFISLLAVGYVSYKREAFALDLKLSGAWSRGYSDLSRRIIQDALGCCGFNNAWHESSFSAQCTSRSSLPGCKGPLLRFERENLTTIWMGVFSLVPLHLINIFISLLCANHVTQTFGKGLTPKQYRLHVNDVRANAHDLFIHLNEAVKRPLMGLPVKKVSYKREDSEFSDFDEEYLPYQQCV